MTGSVARRGWGAAAAASSAAVVLAACTGHSTGPAPSLEPSGSSYASTGPGTPDALAQDRWSRLPAAPIVGRMYAATAWTGKDLFVLGGSAGYKRPLGDGATYDPATREWTKLPTSPLGARVEAYAAWTGDSVIVWGGYGGSINPESSGATYDPSTRQWRVLPKDLLHSGGPATWTGKGLLVLSRTRAHPQLLAEEYVVSTGKWRRLPDPPTLPGHAIAPDIVGYGGGAYVLTPWEGSGIYLATWQFSDATGRWTKLTPDETESIFDRVIWSGRELLVPAARPGSGLDSSPTCQGSECPYLGQRLRPGDQEWRDMSRGPLGVADGATVWTGASLVALAAGSGTPGLDPPVPRRRGARSPTTGYACHRRRTKGMDSPPFGPARSCSSGV